MHILGVDQSLTDCGFMLIHIDDNGAPTYIDSKAESYLVHPDKKKKIANTRDKTLLFEKQYEWFFDQYDIDAVVAEQMHPGINNKNTSVVLGILLGLMIAHTPRHVSIQCHNVTTWRAVLLPQGYSKNPKQAAIDFIYRIFQRTCTEHVAEAGCLGLSYPLLKDETKRSKVARFL